MKFLIILLFCLFAHPSFGAGCKVYGISHSPQKLKCFFKNFDLKLSCQRGHYFLNREKVLKAYHLDVEKGPVPLVFSTTSSHLTVLMNSKVEIRALLKKKSRIFTGTCL